MEEKEEMQKTAEKNEKLSYEQLEAYANQTIQQAQQVFKENQMLKQALNKFQYENTLKEIELAIKCLEYRELFSKEFIENTVKKLEEVLTPIAEEEKEEEKKEKE